MACFIWAAVSFTQINQVTGCDSKIITGGVVALSENLDSLIKGLATVDSNDGCHDSLDMGLMLIGPQINALMNQVTLLKGQLNKCLKIKTPKTPTPGTYKLKALKSFQYLFKQEEVFITQCNF